MECGILKKDVRLTCFSLTGYSGGGKKMIAQYEDSARDKLLDAPRMYALSQAHKHLPEMKAICNLETEPVFCPVVAPYYSGMQVTVPIFKEMAQIDINDIENAYKQYYQGTVVKYNKLDTRRILSSFPNTLIAMSSRPEKRDAEANPAWSMSLVYLTTVP